MVNEKWPPIGVTDMQRRAVEASEKDLAALDSADVFVRLPWKDLQPFVEDAIQQRLSDGPIDAQNVEGAEFEDVEVRPVEQAIEFSFRYKMTLTNVKKVEKVHVQGYLSGAVGVSVGSDAVQLRPALARAQIKKLRYGKRLKAGKYLVPIINAALKHFLDNLNGRFVEPIEVDLDSTQLLSPDLDELLGSREGLQIKSARIGSLQASLSGAAILIDPTQLALLAAIETEAVPPNTEPPAKDAPVDPTVSSDEVEASVLFDQYRRRFFERAATLSPPAQGATVQVSKRKLARALNQIFSYLDVSFLYRVPDHEFGFHEEVGADKAKFKKDCSGLRKECAPHGCNEDCRGRNCDRHCGGRDCGSCSGYSCDRNCGRYKKWDPRRAGCKAKEAACKVEREAKRSACHAKVAACKVKREAERSACHASVAACKTARETKRIACQAEVAACKTKAVARCAKTKTANEARVTTCRVAREAMRIAGQAARLGSVGGTVKTSAAEIDGQIGKISFADGLTEAIVNIDVRAKANVDVRVRFVPKGGGALVCVSDWEKTLSNVARGKLDRGSVAGDIAVSPAQGRALKLEITTRPIDTYTKLDVPPALQIFTEVEIAAKCLTGLAAMAAFGTVKFLKGDSFPKEQARMLEGRFVHQLDPQSVEIMIQPHVLKLGDRRLTLAPTWNDMSVGFVVTPGDEAVSGAPTAPKGTAEAATARLR